jgi:Fur family transcriptional regulator, ferric uptake regulator
MSRAAAIPGADNASAPSYPDVKMRPYRIWFPHAILSQVGGRERTSSVQAGKVTRRDPPPSRVQAALTLLRDRHERVTRARQAIIEVLDGTDEHLAADEIVARAEASAPGVHRATVYRALSMLGDLGLVTHTHVGGSATVYHLAVAAPTSQVAATHAHLQCTNCQNVIDIDADVLDPLISRVDREVGFLVEPHHAALLGLCADCRRSAHSETGQQGHR